MAVGIAASPWRLRFRSSSDLIRGEAMDLVGLTPHEVRHNWAPRLALLDGQC
jgi:hypothetical protein